MQATAAEPKDDQTAVLEDLRKEQAKAKAQLASTLREAITASFTVMGDPKYRACRVFRVTGFGKFNGRYFIDKVTHNFSDEGYTSTIECHKCVTNIR